MFSGSSLIEIRGTFFFFFFPAFFAGLGLIWDVKCEQKHSHNEYDAVNENSPNYQYVRDLDIGTDSQKTTVIGSQLHTSWFLHLWSVPHGRSIGIVDL